MVMSEFFEDLYKVCYKEDDKELREQKLREQLLKIEYLYTSYKITTTVKDIIRVYRDFLELFFEVVPIAKVVIYEEKRNNSVELDNNCFLDLKIPLTKQEERKIEEVFLGE